MSSNRFAELDQIVTVQLDHTSRCNLACPQCARTNTTGKKFVPSPDMDLTVDDYEKILDPFKHRAEKLKLLHVGNYGDVIASPTIDSVMDWCADNNFVYQNIHTNGSLRTPEWWADLARKLPDAQVIFSIDGLADTNHLYRVGANYEKILENAQAFINAGGKANWNFLIFEHNYHQVEQAKELAKKMGFYEFREKKTARFADKKITEMDVTKTNKRTKEVKKINIIRDVKDSIAQKQIRKIEQKYGDFETYKKVTKITCKSIKDDDSHKRRLVYVDFLARVWPCCWTGTIPYVSGKNGEKTPAFFKEHGFEFNSLRKHTWEEVLHHEFYNNYLIESWQDSENRLEQCGRVCGQEFSFNSSSGPNMKNQVLNKDRE